MDVSLCGCTKVEFIVDSLIFLIDVTDVSRKKKKRLEKMKVTSAHVRLYCTLLYGAVYARNLNDKNFF